MKNKYYGVALCALLALVSPNVVAQNTIIVDNLDDIVPKHVGLEGLPRKASPEDIFIPTILSNKTEAIFISSAVPSISPSITLARANLMQGIVGGHVATARQNVPSAWWQIPDHGLQFFDYIVTSGFHSWMGQSGIVGPAETEFGHRLVVSVIGKYPAKQYFCTVASNLKSLLPSTTVGFPVAVNSDPVYELPFNPQYVGIDFGEDGILQSGLSKTTGLWVVGGDDHIYMSGEFPSNVKYDVFVRFGATIAIDAKSTGGFDLAKLDFTIRSPAWFSATLSKSDDLDNIPTVDVVTAKVWNVSGVPNLKISLLHEGKIKVTAEGGPVGPLFPLLSSSAVVGQPWVDTGVKLASGDSVTNSVTGSEKFYRLSQ